MASRLIYVPIEILEERYSKQWHEWFTTSFKANGIKFTTVGDTKERVISTGQFLDVFETNEYKCKQMSEILSIIKKHPSDEYTIFFMDLWFPGIEMLAYLRDGAGLSIKICGMLHAGTWDPHDFLSSKGMGRWAKGFEFSLLQLADVIYLATQFHCNLIENYFRKVIKHKVKLVKWPVIDPIPDNRFSKENIVVFPHRLAPEKAPEEFDLIESVFRKKYPQIEAQFVKSKDVCKTKSEYYELLKRSKVAVSTAKQETFGIAMVEAYNMWCVPVVPDRLSYKEIFVERYKSIEGAVEMIKNGLSKNCTMSFHHTHGSRIDWVKEIVK